MCSVNEEYDETREFMPEEKCQISEESLCQRCNVEKALVVLRGKDVYCNACFLAGATHKFRATLGKSKIVRPADRILVAHSGEAGSTALLHLIKAGMHESVHKRLVFKTKVLYIDEGAVKGQSADQRSTRIRAIRDQVAPLGFESYALSLSQSLDAEQTKIHTLETLCDSLDDLANSDERLKNVLTELSDPTSRLELVKILRRKLLLAASRKLECNKVFLADDSTSLAADILSNVALGRGAQLSLDVGFLDTRFAEVTLLRPMRDFSRHELTTYLAIHNLQILKDEKSSSQASIQGLTEKFVNDLDSRFGGTVSTVFRTGEKVCYVANEDRNGHENCALCDAPLDTMTTSDTAISAIQATAFSRLVSSQGPNGNVKREPNKIGKSSLGESEGSDGCGKCNGTCAKSPEIDARPEVLRQFLCYGCRLIFRDSESLDLPQCLVDDVRRRLGLETMREQIKDFLL